MEVPLTPHVMDDIEFKKFSDLFKEVKKINKLLEKYFHEMFQRIKDEKLKSYKSEEKFAYQQGRWDVREEDRLLSS